MKKTLAFIIAVTSLTTFAGTPTDINLEGIFKHTYPVASYGYPNKKACKEDGGIYKDGACWFKDGGAHVEIKKNADGLYDLVVSSVGTNMHMCDYEEKATQVTETQLLSKSGECEVIVNLTSKDSISVITNGQCQDFCGANMSLDIEEAKRAGL